VGFYPSYSYDIIYFSSNASLPHDIPISKPPPNKNAKSMSNSSGTFFPLLLF